MTKFIEITEELKKKFREYFYYDASSPSCLRRNKDVVSGRKYSITTARMGDVAGILNGGNYWQVGFNGKRYQCHRIIYSLVFPQVDISGRDIDHINGNNADNRISNLRVVEHKVNGRNLKMSKLNTSGVTGVSFKLNNNGLSYCIAQWNDLSGKRSQRAFSVDKLGIMVAFRNAVIYRQKMIEELNLQEAGYTDRHGVSLE